MHHPTLRPSHEAASQWISLFHQQLQLRVQFWIRTRFPFRLLSQHLFYRVTQYIVFTQK